MGVPQISTLTHPVAETIQTHIPAPIATHQPAPIVKTTHVAQPIFKNIPTFGTQEIPQAYATPQFEHIQTPVHTEQTHVVHGTAIAHPPAVAHVATPAVAAVGYAGHVAAPAALGYAGHY